MSSRLNSNSRSSSVPLPDEIEGVAVAADGEGDRGDLKAVILRDEIKGVATATKVDVHGQLCALERAQQRVALPSKKKSRVCSPPPTVRDFFVESDGG